MLKSKKAATPIEVALQQALASKKNTMVMVIALQMLADIEAAAAMLEEGRAKDALQILTEAQWL